MANENSSNSKKSARPLRACQACARRRTRCDQQRACHRCKQIDIECVREEPVRLTKSQLRQEKMRLQARHRALTVVFDALASGKRSDKIIELLRQNEPVEQIAHRLVANCDSDDGGSSHGGYHTDQQERHATSTLFPSSPDQASLAWNSGESTSASPFKLRPEQVPPYHCLEHVPDVVPIECRCEPQQISETLSDSSYSSFISENQHSVSTTATSPLSLNCHGASPWMTTEQVPTENCPVPSASIAVSPCLNPCGSSISKLISIPSNLVLDLADAFFTWHAAPFPAIRRTQFMSDFLNQRKKHCSPALIRIISCLGCRALGGYDTSHSTYASLGNRLFEESRTLLAGPPIHIPDTHACGLLALHQLGIGHYSDAIQLAEEGVKRMAIIMGSEGSPCAGTSEWLEYGAALSSTVTLARFVRLMASSMSERDASRESSLILGLSQEADASLEALLSLRGPLPMDPSDRNIPSSPLLIYSLIDIVYRYFTAIQDPKAGEEYKANYLNDTYRHCLLWYDTALGVGNQQSEVCPFTHMLYYFCLLILWRPAPGSTNTTVCAESAGAILSLAGSSHVRDYQAPNQFFLAHLFVLAASFPSVPAGDHWECSL